MFRFDTVAAFGERGSSSGWVPQLGEREWLDLVGGESYQSKARQPKLRYQEDMEGLVCIVFSLQGDEDC